jgi:hypothetical protein
MTYQSSGSDRRDIDCMLLGPDAPTSASELMYFTGAPLAHVVRYEEEQRASRLRRAYSDTGFLWMPVR